MRAPLQTERQRGRVTHVNGTHAPPIKLPLHGRGAAKPSPLSAPAFPLPCHKRARGIPASLPLLRPPLPQGSRSSGERPTPVEPRVSTTRFPLGRANNLPEGKKRGLWGRTPSPSARRGTQLPKGAWSATQRPTPRRRCHLRVTGTFKGKNTDGLHHTMTMRLSVSGRCDGMGVARC